MSTVHRFHCHLLYLFFFPAWTKANPARGPQKPYTEPQLLWFIEAITKNWLLPKKRMITIKWAPGAKRSGPRLCAQSTLHLWGGGTHVHCPLPTAHTDGKIFVEDLTPSFGSHMARGDMAFRQQVCRDLGHKLLTALLHISQKEVSGTEVGRICGV